MKPKLTEKHQSNRKRENKGKITQVYAMLIWKICLGQGPKMLQIHMNQ